MIASGPQKMERMKGIEKAFLLRDLEPWLLLVRKMALTWRRTNVPGSSAKRRTQKRQLLPDLNILVVVVAVEKLLLLLAVVC